jgi:hypothetical protein
MRKICPSRMLAGRFSNTSVSAGPRPGKAVGHASHTVSGAALLGFAARPVAHAPSVRGDGMQPYRWSGETLDQRLMALSRECRERAEEILVKAETFKDADAREGMRRIAEAYKELAQRLERAAAD